MIVQIGTLDTLMRAVANTWMSNQKNNCGTRVKNNIEIDAINEAFVDGMESLSFL